MPANTPTIPPSQPRIDPQTLAFREWIAAICERKNITRTELARAAGLSHSTLSRATSDAEYRINFRADTIAKIAAVGGIAPPAAIAGGATETPHTGFSEPQATPYLSEREEVSNPNQTTWTCQTTILAATGMVPGDHFLLDQSETPRNRDLIMVQVYDHATGTAESLLRIYADGFAVTPLYLVDGTPRIWLDGTNAHCMGVIVKSWRNRH